MQYNEIACNTTQYNRIQFIKGRHQTTFTFGHCPHYGGTGRHQNIKVIWGTDTASGVWGPGIFGTKSGHLEHFRCPQKGHFGPKRALLGPWGPRRGPIQGRSVWLSWVWQSGGSWDQIWHPRCSGHPTSLFRDRGQIALFGPPGTQWWSWVQHRQANRGQLGPNLVSRGPPRTSEVPERTFYGQNGPFLPVFDRFLELGGYMGYDSAGWARHSAAMLWTP